MMHSTSNDAAVHNHYNSAFRQRVTPQVSGPLNQIYSFYDYNPEHNHTLTKTVSISNLRGKLLKIWLAASSSIPKSSVVIMNCGNLSVLPSYWKVCDGTNGTVDMQNYFLGYATSSGTAHNTTTAANTQYTLTDPTDTASNDWVHAHYSVGNAFQTQQYVYHSTGVHAHTHAVSGGSLTSNYEPAHFKLAFIQLIPT
jgi:hypothetical protein